MTDTNKDGKFTEEGMLINGSMGKLYAVLQLPDLTENEKCPMAILCHGLGMNLDFPLWEPIAQKLNASGIGVLRFDFNGHGKSEGEFQDMTVPNEIDDLMNVISWVRSLKTTQSISLVGHSQGAVVSAMAAGQLGSEQIASIVLISAAAVLRVQALQGNIWNAIFNPWHLDKPWYAMENGAKIGRAYIQTAMDLPIYETAARYRGLALVLNGMADQIVPYVFAQRFHEVLHDSKLILVPGEDHAWTVDPSYPVQLVSSWLIERLKGERGA